MILRGLTTQKSETVAHAIDILPGVYLTDEGQPITVPAITKRLDAVWAPGSGNGGLDTGSKTANTGYFIWLIRDSVSGALDVLLSTAAVNPALPAGFDGKFYLFSILTDGTGDIRPYSQNGGWCDLHNPVTLSFGDISGGSMVAKLAGTPLGKKLMAHIFLASSASTAGYVALKDPDNGTGAITSNAVFYQPASVISSGSSDIWTNASGQILVGGGQSTATATTAILQGWYDDRGQP